MCETSSVDRSLPKPFSAGHSVELKRSTKDDILSLKFPSGMSPAISTMGDSMILSSLEDLDGGRQAAAIAQPRGCALGFNVEEWAC